jgi:sugar lactone lactonase YvrE
VKNVPRFTIRLCILLTSLVLVTSTVGAVPSSASAVSVSTIAGDGVAGDRDGDARAARFLEPVAVAVTADGNTLYVADASGQKIRRVMRGKVDTFAGGGKFAPDGAGRLGTFLDGPASKARFNRPAGIAVAKNGTVYVADSGNHRIRAIRNGVVSTVAGGNLPGGADGRGSSAQFRSPMGIAIDASGNLFVADYGNGIRRVAPDGSVTTLPWPNNKLVLGVSVRGSGKTQVLVYTDTGGLQMIVGSDRFGFTRNTASEEFLYSTGFPNSVAILDEYSALVTDLRLNAVRYYRRGQLGQASLFVRSVVGRNDETIARTGGFRDGDALQAELSAPAGIAWNARLNTAYIADTGNRRIRELRGFSTRRPATTEIASLQGERRAYRIAIVGNSFLHFGVFWDESIAGRIEQRLNAERAKIGLTRPVVVYPIRSDGISGTAEAQYAGEVLTSGIVDLAIVQVNFWNVYANYPQLKADSPWKSEYASAFRNMNASFKKSRVPVMVVTYPDGYGASPLERYSYRQEHDAWGSSLEAERALAKAVDASGARHLRLLERILAHEAGDRGTALYLQNDSHLTVAGNIFVGDAIAKYIEDWKPWARPPGK